jgi:hypothetical protein
MSPITPDARRSDSASSASEPAPETKPISEGSGTDPGREFVEDPRFLRCSSENEDEIVGFEAEPGFEVGETADSFLPAEILIELSPEDAKPGERYVVRVSLFNAGYRPIRIASLEIVSRFGGKTVGKGQPIPVAASQVPPQATAVIYEVAGTWKESLNEGDLHSVTWREACPNDLRRRLH